MLQFVHLYKTGSGITRDDDGLIYRHASFDAFSSKANCEDTISFRCDSEGVSRTVVPARESNHRSNFTVSFCNGFPKILRGQKNSFIEMRTKDSPALNVVMLISDLEMDFIFEQISFRGAQIVFSFLPDVETDFSYGDGDVLVFPVSVTLKPGAGWSGRYDVSYYSFGSNVSIY